MRRCPFCQTNLEIVGSGGFLDTWRCPVCHYQEGAGLEKLPNADRLRDRADRLEQLADEIENGSLAETIDGGAV